MSEKEAVAYRFGGDVPVSVEISPRSVGNKAANLIRMTEFGLPVPAGFVLTTRACREYFDRGGRLPVDMSTWLSQGMEHLEQVTGQKLGGGRRPLLVSVRSGAPVSMPGMMDTILNVGLCQDTVSPLICMTGNPRFVWDAYRRLVKTYAEVVHAQSADKFDQLLAETVRAASGASASELDARALRELTQQYLELYADLVGESFPQSPLTQLGLAVEAVFRSWRSPRAIDYRRMHGIDDCLGTAVTVQQMVFGNMGNTSGSGVAFTRDPTTGRSELYLDFLWNAQGEDIVSGRLSVQDGSTLGVRMPALDRQLRQVSGQLEKLFQDAQDFEFTIQEGRLYLLQSREAKRTPLAALQVACDLVNEGLINPRTAVERLAEIDLDSIQMTRLSGKHSGPPLSTGVAACPGVAIGPVALNPLSAVRMAREGSRPILVRHEFATDDVTGLAASAGILTRLGGRTSHAAVVARQMNKVCVVGCGDLTVERDRCRIGDNLFVERDFLSLDGNSGAIYRGKLDVVSEKPVELLANVKDWQQALRVGQA